MTKFQFDPNLTQTENISRFFDHLATINDKMAEILRQNISELLPLPEPGQPRNVKRQTANRKIATALDVLPSDSNGVSS